MLPASLILWAERELGHLWPHGKHTQPGVISVVPKPPCAILQIPQAQIPPLKSRKKEQGEAGTEPLGHGFGPCAHCSSGCDRRASRSSVQSLIPRVGQQPSRSTAESQFGDKCL